jgi:hypothetical protein
MKITAKIELGQMEGGHCVNVWLDDRLVEVFGPIQAEKAAIVQKAMQEHVKRLREQIAKPLDEKLSETHN